MKKLFLISIFLLSLSAAGQEVRYIYEYNNGVRNFYPSAVIETVDGTTSLYKIAENGFREITPTLIQNENNQVFQIDPQSGVPELFPRLEIRTESVPVVPIVDIPIVPN